MSAVHATEMLVFWTFVQIIIMIVAARAMNFGFRRMGQPGVIGEIVAGLLLGPSLFGHFFPEIHTALFKNEASTSITILSQIGLTLLMFQIGADFEFRHLSDARNSRKAVAIAAASIAVPLGLGILIGEASHAQLAAQIDPHAYSLFVGVALAITALPILGRILAQFGLTRAELGVVAITAAAINDVLGWILLALISAYVTAQLSTQMVLLQFAGIAAFAFALRYIATPLVGRALVRWPARDGTIPANVMAGTLCLIFLLAICTFKLHLFAIFGGFAAGLLYHRHVPFVEAWQKQVGQFVLVFFLPIFFTFTGLRTNMLGLGMADLPWLAAILVAAIGGKILPVYLAARATGSSKAEALTYGSLMNTRALMELIVLNIGYEFGVLPQNMFTMLVLMAVVTTVMTGPILRRLLPRIGHTAPEEIEA